MLKVGKTATLGFSSPLWTNSELLNEASEMATAEDAKYSEFNTEPFKKMRMCIGSPLSNCVDHAFETRYDSAKALFSAGYIRDESVKQDEILKTFGPAKGSYRDCPMQRPGNENRLHAAHPSSKNCVWLCLWSCLHEAWLQHRVQRWQQSSLGLVCELPLTRLGTLYSPLKGVYIGPNNPLEGIHRALIPAFK